MNAYVFILLITICSLLAFANAEVSKSRQRRYVGFLEKTKFFVRLNSKHNMVQEFLVFAQGTGFRANFDLPIRWDMWNKRKRHRIVRRDVYQNLEELIMHHGFDGRACVLRTLCEASNIVTPESGILLKLYKRIFTIPDGDEQYYPYLNSEKCEELNLHCPLSVLELTKYTDMS